MRPIFPALQYSAAIAMILSALRAFRSLKDVPGLRVYTLVAIKAYPRLKDFAVFFILAVFFLSIRQATARAFLLPAKA